MKRCNYLPIVLLFMLFILIIFYYYFDFMLIYFKISMIFYVFIIYLYFIIINLFLYYIFWFNRWTGRNPVGFLRFILRPKRLPLQFAFVRLCFCKSLKILAFRNKKYLYNPCWYILNSNSNFRLKFGQLTYF
jgi:hypothetical protein